MHGGKVPSIQQGRGSVSEPVCATLTTGDLKSASPGSELLSLGRGAMDGGEVFIFVRKVEVQVQAAPDACPDSVPCFCTRPSASNSSWSWIPCPWGGPRTSSVVAWAMARFAVPDFRSGGITKASAEDVDGTIAAIAIHGAVRAVDISTDETWSIFIEQGIIDDQGRVDVSLLLLLLNDVRRVSWAIEVVAKFDDIEACATDGATVGSFNPRAQAGVVKVVSARKEVGNDLIVYGMLAVWIVSTGLKS
jgi:hypothetical protein